MINDELRELKNTLNQVNTVGELKTWKKKSHFNNTRSSVSASYSFLNIKWEFLLKYAEMLPHGIDYVVLMYKKRT
jgi:hypothetical protein